MEGTSWDRLVRLLAAAGGAVAGALGGWDTMLQVLAVMMVLDYVTGLLAAWMGRSTKTETGHLDSRAGFAGLCRKALMLLVVLMCAAVDRLLPSEAAVFRSMMIWFYVANEGLSVLENLALAGVPFPSAVRKALEQVRDRTDAGEAP